MGAVSDIDIRRFAANLGLLPLAGTPDPTVDARPNATGMSVVLTFIGAESAESSGFAELHIRGGT